MAIFQKKSFCPRKNIFHKVVINRFVKNVYNCEYIKDYSPESSTL